MKITVLAVALITACASVAVVPSEAAPAVVHRPGRLSRAELESQRGRSLGDAIRALDGGLLMNRGEAVQVWIDGSSYAPSVLETLPANDVQEVVRLNAADARQMFGERAHGAALVVTTRHGGSR